MAPEKEPRNTKKLAIIIGASVLALILIVVGAVLFRNHQTRVAEERAAEAARIAEEQRLAELDRQETAAETSVEGFMTALTESDAEKALTFAASTPEGNNDLLTREVLTEANRKAALTGVTVDDSTLTESTPGTWTEGTVKLRYSIGDQAQTVDLPVRKVGEEWKVDQVSAPVKLGLTGPERLVNGARVRPGAYNLFPGAYSVTSANPLVGLEQSDFVLASPVDPSTDWESNAVLSDEGRNQTLDASRRAVDECLKSKELSPPNCPFIRWAEADGLVIDKPSLRYTLKNDPWRDVQFRFSAGTMTASTTVTIDHEINAQATQNGRRGTLEPKTQSRPAFISVKLGDGTPQVSFT